MGGQGSGRKPSEATIVKRLNQEPRTPVATQGADGIYLPNHSGDHSAGRVKTTPTTDYELVNKKYVDDNAINTVSDTSTIDMTLSGVDISAVTIDSAIDHDALLNFVANEHIDWTDASVNFKTSEEGLFEKGAGAWGTTTPNFASTDRGFAVATNLGTTTYSGANSFRALASEVTYAPSAASKTGWGYYCVIASGNTSNEISTLSGMEAFAVPTPVTGFSDTVRNNYGANVGVFAVGGNVALDAIGLRATVTGCGSDEVYGINIGTVTEGAGTPTIRALKDESDADWSLSGADNKKFFMGIADDCSIYYDSTDMCIDSAEVGTGALKTMQGRKVNTTRATTTYTILVTDDNIFCNTDGSAWTATLPAGAEGQRFRIINSGSSLNDLTIAPNGSEHLLGANSNFILRDGETLEIVYNATDGWY